MPDDLKTKIEVANAEAVQRINAAQPALVDVLPAPDVIPGLGERMILHSGPPVGWAQTPAAAEALPATGEIALDANHHHDAVGPMAGTISPSLPVYVVENRAHGNRAYRRNVEGWQQFGRYDDAALAGLRAWRDVQAPARGAGLRDSGGLDLKQLIARALTMGDELHNRPNAATALFGLEMGRRMLEAGVDKGAVIGTLALLGANEFAALGLAMAAAKATADSLCGLEYSTVVRAMASNGTEFGIRMAGLGDEWFTAPAPRVEGVYEPGMVMRTRAWIWATRRSPRRSAWAAS